MALSVVRLPQVLDDTCDATGAEPVQNWERETAPKSPKRLVDAG